MIERASSAQPLPVNYAEKWARTLSATATGAFGVFVMITIAPLFGALSGWILSIVLPSWVSGGFAALGLHVDPSDFYKIGACLAWVGGFFKFARPNPKSEAA